MINTSSSNSWKINNWLPLTHRSWCQRSIWCEFPSHFFQGTPETMCTLSPGTCIRSDYPEHCSPRTKCCYLPYISGAQWMVVYVVYCTRLPGGGDVWDLKPSPSPSIRFCLQDYSCLERAPSTSFHRGTVRTGPGAVSNLFYLWEAIQETLPWTKCPLPASYSKKYLDSAPLGI